jgi:transposase
MQRHREAGKHGDRAALIEYVHLLRYGPTAARTPGTVYASVPQIAKVVRRSPTQVRTMLRLGVGARQLPGKGKPGRASKLTGQHIQFLVSQDTLARWAAKTLDERVVLFHRQFGEVMISRVTLLKIYARHKISRKSFRYVKTLNIKNPHLRDAEIEQLKASVADSQAKGRKMIFTDEAMFTTATFPSKGYARRGLNVTIEEKLTSSPALAVVAGVSAEGGLEGFYMQPRSIDSDAFIQYLLHLVEKNDPSTFTVFLDNCRVHHSIKVKDFIKENNIDVIYNVPYGPEFNAIERVWAQLKLRFKKQRLNAVLSGVSPNYNTLVKEIVLGYPQHKICSIVQGTMKSQLA